MLNKVTLLGRLSKDPEVSNTNGGKQVAKFSLAVSRKLGKNAKADAVKADFFNVVAWEGLAGVVSQFCKKGKQIVVVGKLQNRNWTDDAGTKHYITEIVAEDIVFADTNKSDSGTSTSASTQSVADTNQGFYAIPDDDELPF